VGRKLGASAQAALTTRGFHRAGTFGARLRRAQRNHDGISGLGDLILTCSSLQSRNFALGLALGRGEAKTPRQARRRRIHRARIDRTGGFARNRYAGIECGGGDLARRDDDRRGDRKPVWRARSRRRNDNGILAGEVRTFCVVVDQQVAKGAKGEAWTGVRNFTARQNLVKMKKGDLAFFYHSNEGKEIVGIAEIIKEAYPDPTDKIGKFVCVDIKADKPLKTPVTMAAIKADKAPHRHGAGEIFAALVQLVTAEEWKMVCKMGGV